MLNTTYLKYGLLPLLFTAAALILLIACTPATTVAPPINLATPTTFFDVNQLYTPEPAQTDFDPVIKATAVPVDWDAFFANEATRAAIEQEATLEPVLIMVDASETTHTISELIYGVTEPSDQFLRQAQPKFVSTSGEKYTRYNWRLGDAWNLGLAENYANTSFDFRGNHAAEEFVKDAQDSGAASRLTLPTIGWVAKDNNQQTCSFPLENGQCSTGAASTCRSSDIAANPLDTSIENTPADIELFLKQLEESGRIPDFFGLGNEPELWGINHFDVHPTCTTYREILDTFLAYATVIREAVPAAQLTGPATCCWHYYWNSDAGSDDKRLHDNQDFLPWFLDQMRIHDEAAGERHLDVLDIHYLPEGVANTSAGGAIHLHRSRVTRSLYDPEYADESWIREPVQLIPRFKDLIDQHYPGTKLAIGEWYFGAHHDTSGGLAIADVLGIMGREDVYFAALTPAPEAGSPADYSFRMYTNYDGFGGTFGDLSTSAVSSDPDQVAAHASIDSETGNLHIIVINKYSGFGRQVVGIDIANFNGSRAATTYIYDGPDFNGNEDGIIKAENVEVGNTITLVMRAETIMHIIIPAR